MQNPHCSHQAELSNWTLAEPSLGWSHLYLGLVPNQMIGSPEASCCPLPPELRYLSQPPETQTWGLQPTEGWKEPWTFDHRGITRPQFLWL